jgi:hypothetical protein
MLGSQWGLGWRELHHRYHGCYVLLDYEPVLVEEFSQSRMTYISQSLSADPDEPYSTVAWNTDALNLDYPKLGYRRNSSRFLALMHVRREPFRAYRRGLQLHSISNRTLTRESSPTRYTNGSSNANWKLVEEIFYPEFTQASRALTNLRSLNANTSGGIPLSNTLALIRGKDVPYARVDDIILHYSGSPVGVFDGDTLLVPPEYDFMREFAELSDFTIEVRGG